MADLHAHHDYRDFLKEVYEERKQRNPLYSYRLFADRLGMDVSQFYRILAKDTQLPLRFVDLFCKELKLDKRSAQVFALQVSLGRAKSEKEKRVLYEKLLGLRDVERKTLSREQFRFFAQWQASTLRCLIGAGAFRGDYKVLAAMVRPAITENECRDSVETLLALGLVQKGVKGMLQLSEMHLSTGDTPSEVIRAHQAHMLRLAAEGIERFPREARDYSSLTFGVDGDCARDIANMLRECRRQIQKRIGESGQPDRVLHLNMSLFPTAVVGSKDPWVSAEGSKP